VLWLAPSWVLALISDVTSKRANCADYAIKAFTIAVVASPLLVKRANCFQSSHERTIVSTRRKSS